MTTSSDPTETAVIGGEPPSPISVNGISSVVYLGRKADGFFAMDPGTARDIARRLLVEADHAEGRVPAHIYKVDNR